MNDELKLRNRLKEARFEKKLSQSQLAEMVGGFAKHDQFDRDRTI